MTTTVKTKQVTTPHGTFTVPAVTATTHNGRTYYTTHCYNSMGQPVSGGFNFPASPSAAATCKHFGVPVVNS